MLKKVCLKKIDSTNFLKNILYKHTMPYAKWESLPTEQLRKMLQCQQAWEKEVKNSNQQKDTNDNYMAIVTIEHLITKIFYNIVDTSNFL